MKNLCFTTIHLLLLLLLLLNGRPAARTTNAFLIINDSSMDTCSSRQRATPSILATTTTTTTSASINAARPAILPHKTRLFASAPNNNKDDDYNNKFGFGQRIESIKCLVVGAIAGGVAVAPVCAVHNLLFLSIVEPMVLTNNVAQWELMNDLAALQAGLFAIVYRYCIRLDANNPQLGQGVVGAFALTRTLGSLVVPAYCTTIPLNCKSNDMFAYCYCLSFLAESIACRENRLICVDGLTHNVILSFLLHVFSLKYRRRSSWLLGLDLVGANRCNGFGIGRLVWSHGSCHGLLYGSKTDFEISWLK